VFTRQVGTSPQRFVRHLALADIKRRLAAGAGLLDSALDAGLSGGARAHDLFVAFDAITPGEYKRGGEGLTMRFGVSPTPFGDALFAAGNRGLCALRFVPDGDAGIDSLLAEIAADWPEATLKRDDKAASDLARRVFNNSGGKARRVPLHIRGTNFQINVWRALLAIPPGAAASYRMIADAIGRPQAARAVGAAAGKNPAAWIIPCHRVLGEAGNLCGYRWGLPRKRAMLSAEFAAAEA
jgi:AraC family transcriptional regulator of adaptative response/methylated-DNA-[protein]-cysteine methyltransferase